MNRMSLSLLACAFAAGTIGSDADASAMKCSVNTAPIRRSASPEVLPLRPPALPEERDRLLESLMTPNSVASRALLIETRHPFSRATLVASTRHANTVKPGARLSVAKRPNPGPIPPETARFTLPEPASILLVLTGLIGLTARRQMRRYDAKHA